MIDQEGYRPNVAIVILNDNKQVFWAKRVAEDAWQFPQGGINEGESIEEAMYRELMEEVAALITSIDDFSSLNNIFKSIFLKKTN